MKKVFSIIGIIIIAGAIAIFAIISNKPDSNRYLSEHFTDYGDIKPLNIWLATDTHYIAPELTDGGTFYQSMIESGDGKYMYACEEITDEFISQVIEAKPDALIIAGDLTFNGARLSHEGFVKKLRQIEDAGVQVLTIPGNHDFTLKRAAKFSGENYELVESIDASDYLDLYGDFGYSQAIAKDDTSLSYVYELSDNVRVLAVDVNTVAGMSGILTKATLKFVEEQLIKAREDKAYVISVTHQTLLTHSELTSQGIIFINNDKLLELYEKYGVLCNLSGHMHIQHMKQSKGGVWDIATGSLMTAPNYHGVISLKNRKFTYDAVSTLKNSWPEIGQNARDFLWNNAYRQAQETLSESSSSINSGKADLMAEFFADFNVNYIAGRADLIDWNQDLIDAWHETDTFVPKYIDIVKEECSKANSMVSTSISW